jgi:hypothetical protein
LSDWRQITKENRRLQDNYHGAFKQLEKGLRSFGVYWELLQK